MPKVREVKEMKVEEAKKLIKEAKADTQAKGSAMRFDVEMWKTIEKTIKARKTGALLPFETVKELVGSNSKSLNNFVYQLNKRFIKHGIKLHAGMRHTDNKEGVALNIRQ